MNNEQTKIAEHRAAERVDYSTPLCEMCEENPVGYIEVNWANQRWFQDELCDTCWQEVDAQA